MTPPHRVWRTFDFTASNEMALTVNIILKYALTNKKSKMEAGNARFFNFFNMGDGYKMKGQIESCIANREVQRNSQHSILNSKMNDEIYAASQYKELRQL